MFLVLQIKEFFYSYLSITDCIIGSIFYFTTGLHGMHVIFGLLYFFFILIFSICVFLVSCYLSINYYSSSSLLLLFFLLLLLLSNGSYTLSLSDFSYSCYNEFSFSYLISSYYWHFVDLIWFLVFLVYFL